ncbi:MULTISPECIES: hypothetical protein [Bradyrhizobium]|jgi:hypothetical protein|uniref:hypothetical protein n=1 Tax=Bradyrhizobium TaxID=374 RepID=UPI0021687DE5|nr:hypothetical protein [Bradyrhizobium elkanii]MCS3480265.1 hypothetical protein [Bradyrhizobium elkanii]MCW2130160.1 hypothetical protein [Bradyrhizobium elkanii]MCW2167837.1 hypothetical protein [Bradyrhizobium elkanii]
MASKTPLEERIIQIRKECDEIIDRHVAEIKKDCDSIPVGVLRQDIEIRARGCPCAQAMHVMGKTAELYGAE